AGARGRAAGAGGRSNGHSPGVLPAYHHRPGQHQQRTGARLWHSHRVSRGLRLDLGHDSPESIHDARADGEAAADATLAAGMPPPAAKDSLTPSGRRLRWQRGSARARPFQEPPPTAGVALKLLFAKMNVASA